MVCVAPKSADPRRGLSEISNLDGFSSAANDRFRRMSVVVVCSGEGPLTEPTPAVQPSRREPLFMPQSGRSARLTGGTVLDETRVHTPPYDPGSQGQFVA